MKTRCFAAIVAFVFLPGAITAATSITSTIPETYMADALRSLKGPSPVRVRDIVTASRQTEGVSIAAFSWIEGAPTLASLFPQINRTRSHILANGRMIDDRRLVREATTIGDTIVKLSRTTLPRDGVSSLGYEPGYSTGVYAVVGSQKSNRNRILVERPVGYQMPVGISSVTRISLGASSYLVFTNTQNRSRWVNSRIGGRLMHYKHWTAVPAKRFIFTSSLKRTTMPERDLVANANGYLDRDMLEFAQLSMNGTFRFGMVVQANYYARCCFDLLPSPNPLENSYLIAYNRTTGSMYFEGYGTLRWHKRHAICNL